MIRPPSYWHRLGDATSQWFNVALINGNANESISGRTWRKAWLWTESVIDTVLGHGHCEEAYITDLARSLALLRAAPVESVSRAQAMLEARK